MKARRRMLLCDIQLIINDRLQQKTILIRDLCNFLDEQIRLSRYQNPKFITAVKAFKVFLKPVNEVRLDEELLDHFNLWVKENKLGLGGSEFKQAPSNLLAIINTLKNQEYLKVPIILGRTRSRVRSFRQLTEKSREMLLHFEANARQVKTNRLPYKNEEGQIQVFSEFILLKKKLAEIPKFNRMDLLMTFMKRTGLDDFAKVTLEAIKEVAMTVKCLKEVGFVFANFHQNGFLPSNPFCHFDRPLSFEITHLVEFVTQEGIDSLHRGAFHIHKMSHEAARSLCYCLLAYDTCLRAGELRALTLSDFTFEDDMTTLRIRSEIQKGQNKIERYLLILFDETVHALKYYLKEVRPSLKSQDDILFIQSGGRGLSHSVMSKGIDGIAETFALKINDNVDKHITSHHFRRTFGTLNAPGIGLNLPLDELAERMRHSDPKTTRTHYIANNSYLEKMKLVQKKQLFKKRTPKGKFQDVSDFLIWLKSEIGVPDLLLSELRTYIKTYEINKKLAAAADKYTMSQDEALKRLAAFNLKLSGLTKHCLEKKKALLVEEGMVLFNGDYIRELEADYCLIDEALKILYISPKTIYNNAGFFYRIKIGRHVLVKRSSVFRYKESHLE
jgi:hypothetical protein